MTQILRVCGIANLLANILFGAVAGLMNLFVIQLAVNEKRLYDNALYRKYFQIFIRHWKLDFEIEVCAYKCKPLFLL